MEQIDTTAGVHTQYSNNYTQFSQVNTQVSKDVEKLQLQEMVQDFMNQNEINKRMRNMINSNMGKNPRFNVNVDDLRQFNPRLAAFVTKDPLSALKMFQDQLNLSIKGLKDDAGMKTGSNPDKMAVQQDNFPKKTQVYYINFEGNFGRNHVTPRGLRAELLNQYVAVSGIVTRMSIVKPHIQTSVHYCEETKRGHVVNYNDPYNLDQLADAQDENHTALAGGADGNGFKTVDNNGNPLTAEYGFCVYRDYQEIIIQEMPERAPTGQLPRSIKVILENDLVDKVKPGDRINVMGVFRARLNANKTHSALTENYIIATGVSQLNYEKEKPNLDEVDIRNIKKLSKEKELFDILGGSVASSIEGNLDVKKALLLQLLGGAEKNLETGTHLRGDINILMVGDPSTAKSQLLRHIMDIAPLAINTTGRGSTGVGLTAAVTMDKDTGEKHLEAGAMVLADRGIVCIDEFDKMNDCDKVAIHEVMEQQTVTIAKAGLHVSLNARCSVIAAANPLYGEYARDAPVGKNIGMPDSLLSRFDLLFVMLDEKDPENDRKIAQRVIANHRYLAPNTHGELASVFNYTNEDIVVEADFHEKKHNQEKQHQVYEKALLSVNQKGNQIVTRDFLKKYISYAKSLKSPELHEDCIEYASNLYSLIRTKALNYDQSKISMPITVRTLETMIRLATAHAKLRLSKTVDPSDIEIAINLLNSTIFQETERAQKENPEEAFEEEDEDEHMYDEANDNENEVIKKNNSNTRSQRYATRHGDVLASPAKNENKNPNMQPNGKRAKRDEKSPKKKDEVDTRPTKRLRTDSVKTNGEETTPVKEQNEVSKLISTAAVSSVVDMTQKKLLYKLISENKDADLKTTIDKLWRAFMAAPESETFKRGKAIIQSKPQLVQIVEELEKDNLVMYSNADGNVVLI